MVLNSNDVVEILCRIAKKIANNKDYITELDSATGDGDHWANMNMGFEKIVSDKDNLKTLPIDELLKKVGMTLMATIGGSSGVLYGVAFIGSAKAIKGKVEADKNDIAVALEAGLEAMMKRGNAKPGYKTMIDTFYPAVEAYKDALEAGKELKEILLEVKKAAIKGMKATKDMVATMGRATYQADKGVGHLDPGAVTMSYMFEEFADYVNTL